MELELGLALVPPSMKGFDLNTTWLDHEADQKKKPMFPLVSWNGMPNEEEDDHKREKERTSSITTDNDEGDESGVIGWPPIKSWRKKLFHGYGQQVGRIITDHRKAAAAAERRGGTSNFRTNSTYVKVKMEGVGIARKIDLRLYRSYQTLTRSLITMFTKYQQIDKDSAHYTLLYQDNEGDWLLAETFHGKRLSNRATYGDTKECGLIGPVTGHRRSLDPPIVYLVYCILFVCFQIL